jgi:predicted dehydrogenase
MLRVCVIGLGAIGNLHASIYKEDPLANLVGVCDVRRDRADAAATRLGVQAYYGVQEMLDAIRPDICSVTTGGYEYGSEHYLPTIQALEAGCHVLCEKPISNQISKAGRWWPKPRKSISAWA